MSDDTKRTVVTAVGSDATGLVNGVTERIHEAGANIEDSRMAVLGGEFTLMILVAGNADTLGQMRELVTSYASDQQRLDVFFKDTSRGPTRGGQRFRLEVSGLDHPGIVRQVAGVLARSETNVDAMETKLVPAPMSGAMTFVITAQLTLAPTVSAEQLREHMQEVCDTENLDLALEPVI